MSKSCKECAHNNSDFIDKVCLDCYWPELAEEPSNFKPKPVTNADRIRNMSNEELAVWIAETSCCSDWCILKDACDKKQEHECCINVWLDWLNQESE